MKLIFRKSNRTTRSRAMSLMPHTTQQDYSDTQAAERWVRAKRANSAETRNPGAYRPKPRPALVIRPADLQIRLSSAKGYKRRGFRLLGDPGRQPAFWR